MAGLLVFNFFNVENSALPVHATILPSTEVTTKEGLCL